MKKAFSTLACLNESLKMVVELSGKYKMDGIEIRLDKKEEAFGLKGTALAGACELFRSRGIEISNFGSSVCIKEYNKECIEHMKCAIDTASEAGVKGVRLFLGNFAPGIRNEVLYFDHEGIVKSLRELCEYAQRRKTEVWIETHNEYATGRALRKLLDEVQSGNLKIIWDIIHPIEDGEGIYETWELIGDAVAHVHVKDGVKSSIPGWHDYTYTLLGEGELPVREVIKLLENEQFGGYISFEWERAWREELKKYPDSLDFALKQYAEFLAE